MCFDYDSSPSVFRENYRTAKKPHICCECGLPIHPGERYLEVFGVWDSEPATYRICSVCEWFRERIAAAEMEHGCRAHEAYPAFGCLSEALGEGHAEMIGLVDVNTWLEQEEDRP